jgi:hypothetical protein
MRRFFALCLGLADHPPAKNRAVFGAGKDAVLLELAGPTGNVLLALAGDLRKLASRWRGPVNNDMTVRRRLGGNRQQFVPEAARGHAALAQGQFEPGIVPIPDRGRVFCHRALTRSEGAGAGVFNAREQFPFCSIAGHFL